MTFAAEKASFRDPEGVVFYSDNRVFRAVSEAAYADLSLFEKSGLKAELESSGDLVRTNLHLEAALLSTLCGGFPGYPRFVEHEKLPFISHPYEWSFSMLCDAALFHLELQRRLLKSGFTLKDASAFNVQFAAARPVFIDLLSIEPLSSSYWAAYAQFCRMFFFPLALMSEGRVDLKSYFLGHLDGWTAGQTYRAMGLLKSLRGANRSHIFIQQLFQRGDPQRTAAALQSQESRASVSPDLQMKLTGAMAEAIRRLRARGPGAGSHWVDYVADNSYGEEDAARKEAFVADALRELRPGRVVDLGCNTGRFSRLAAENGAFVLAVDSDHHCVDELYQSIAGRGAKIQPLWMDLSNPSPGLGFGGAERADFFARGRGDLVLALALSHHLLVSGGLRPEMLAETLYRLTEKHLLVEWISPEDAQFRRIVGLRRRDFSFFTEPFFVDLFSKAGRPLRSTKLSATRSLHLFEKTR